MINKQIIVLALYALDISLCLLAIKKESKPGYAATKPFLMPLLLCLYLTLLPQSLRDEKYQVFIALALILHTIGDILLLYPKDKSMKFFYIGMVVFFSGHMMYVKYLSSLPVGHNILFPIISVIVVFFLEYQLFKQLMDGSKKYAPKLLPYTLGLAAVLVAVSSTIGEVSHIASIITLFGVSLFCFSDYCIFRRTIKKPIYGQLVIISTYIAGQSAIVMGMLLMQRL